MTAMAHTHNIETEAVPEQSQAGRLRWVHRINTALFAFTAIPAALLVLAEIAVLLAGIIGRYVFRSPLVWSDELRGILFLWLAMLGSVLAFQRDEHMRMTAIVGKLRPGPRAFLDVVAVAASLAFLVSSSTPLTSLLPTRFTSRRLRSTSSTPGAPRRCRSALD